MYKLSIVIPCYNCEDNILGLLSVIPYHQDVEVILVDDGSKDNTKSVIENYIRSLGLLHNIHFFSKKNEGAAKTRQFGLNKSKGDYVFFCDADDYLVSNFFNSILSKINASAPDIIYFNSLVATNLDNYTKYLFKVKFNNEITYSDPNMFLTQQLKNNCWTAAVWTFVFKKSLVSLGGAYFTSRKAHEDHMFVISLLYSAKNIHIINKILYVQKVTIGSLTNSAKDWNYIYQRYIAYIEIKDKFNSKINEQTMDLYTKWSLSSFFRLVFESKKTFSKCLIELKFYKIAFDNLSFIIKMIFK